MPRPKRRGIAVALVDGIDADMARLPFGRRRLAQADGNGRALRLRP